MAPSGEFMVTVKVLFFGSLGAATAGSSAVLGAVDSAGTGSSFMTSLMASAAGLTLTVMGNGRNSVGAHCAPSKLNQHKCAGSRPWALVRAEGTRAITRTGLRDDLSSITYSAGFCGSLKGPLLAGIITMVRVRPRESAIADGGAKNPAAKPLETAKSSAMFLDERTHNAVSGWRVSAFARCKKDSFFTVSHRVVGRGMAHGAEGGLGGSRQLEDNQTARLASYCRDEILSLILAKHAANC